MRPASNHSHAVLPPTAARLSWTLRLHRAWASAALATFGVGCGTRTARWLAILSACESGHPGHAVANDGQSERARRRLDEAGRAEVLRVLSDPRTLQEEAKLQACLQSARQRAGAAEAEALRLEALLPAGALPEPTGFGIRCLIAVSLLAEGWLSFESLSLVMVDNPLGLLISAVVAAPLAAVLLDRAGKLCRGCVWRGRVAGHEIALLLGLLACPAALGIGITLSRVLNVATGHAAALWVSAGLQAVLLALPFVCGYNGADPVPGLRVARRRHARASAALHRLQGTVAHAHAERNAAAAHVDQQLHTAHAAFDHWLGVYGAQTTGGDSRNRNATRWRNVDDDAPEAARAHRTAPAPGSQVDADARWALVRTAQ